MKIINNINGIPLHYARLTGNPYGTRGIPRDFAVDDLFLKTLEAAFKEVFKNCPLGVPEVITTAGILVNKPGQHGHGRAFDLDAIFWQNDTLVTLNFLHQKELYIGVESYLRRHFGIVLNYFYPNHQDHWHVDTSVPVDFNESSRSETYYLQMALKYIFGMEVLVDGSWGRQTQAAVRAVFERLGIRLPITTKKNYLQFLETTGNLAFELSKAEASPARLLANLTDVLRGLPVRYKNGALEALNSFADHQETVEWLNGLDGDPHAHG
ncbi:hypothetical protein RQM65_06150 [Pricia sp. S334]|uniref:Extensin-like C-terminal domain-containing protein n=1 Tax=Pricia mediterranea TaxID=3076079 RepID=A0ABU3L3C3_9FLAO|nr:hypothetical protein [Pricia sp. S334]MDT7828239.1 hypothetical protein [Pricia sp. S334]